MMIILKGIAYVAGALVALPFAIMAGATADWVMTVQKIADDLSEEVEKKNKEK